MRRLIDMTIKRRLYLVTTVTYTLYSVCGTGVSVELAFEPCHRHMRCALVVNHPK